jgi:signal transduction histidine kinase
MESAPLIGYDQFQRKIRDRLGGKMGREDGQSGALQAAPGNNFKLNTRRSLAGSVLFADAGAAMAGPGASATAGLTSDVRARARRVLALIAAGAAALIVPFAFDMAAVNAPSLHAALATMMTLFALAAAWLLRAQFASSRRGRDLLLVASALALGLLTFGAAAVPAAADLRGGTYFAGAELWGELILGAMFAAAAFAPSDWLIARRDHPVAITLGLSVVALATAGLGGLLIQRHGSVATLAGTFGQPLVLVLVVGATGLLAYAAVGFAHRPRVEGDRSTWLLAIAMMLMAGASFSHVMRGSLIPGRIDPSAGLTAIGYALILAVAVVRERQVHARFARATALAERRRVARDLHDGIAQDLAFIAAHGPRFAKELGDEHPVVIAAKRALALSRSAISDLSDPAGATAHESLDAIARELQDRFEIAISVDANLDQDLESGERENVTRIAREAIANAARHGKAQNVIVSLRHNEQGVVLRVLDDGCGIGAGQSAAPDGFGLRSMRERAAALGGELSVRQPQRGGTELEVVLP